MQCIPIFLTVFLVVLFPAGAGRASLEAYPEEQPGVAEKSICDFPGAANPDGRYAEMTWEKLIPPNWNPAGVFDGLNLDMLEDNDPRAEDAMKKIKKMWDEAPTNPALQGKAIEISGFVASLDFTGKAELKEFLLVPYFGACIHVPPPPANQIIHVTLNRPRKGIRAMDEVTVYGTLAIEKKETDLGRSGYDLKADAVAPYVEKKK
ncbi:MAG: DUF3299 domain-containing protein [Betaproteobacteria bacterium]|nr:DUF3299 domain-containing protein [Betaproteobacteria bacterium]